jgi:hypothetical protein
LDREKKLKAKYDRHNLDKLEVENRQLQEDSKVQDRRKKELEQELTQAQTTLDEKYSNIKKNRVDMQKQLDVLMAKNSSEMSEDQNLEEEKPDEKDNDALEASETLKVVRSNQVADSVEFIRRKLSLKRVKLDEAFELVISSEETGVKDVALSTIEYNLRKEPFCMAKKEQARLVARYLVEENTEDRIVFDIKRRSSKLIVKSIFKNLIGHINILPMIEVRQHFEKLINDIQNGKSLLMQSINSISLKNEKQDFVNQKQLLDGMKQAKIDLNEETTNIMLLHILDKTENPEEIRYNNIYQIFSKAYAEEYFESLENNGSLDRRKDAKYSTNSKGMGLKQGEKGGPFSIKGTESEDLNDNISMKPRNKNENLQGDFRDSHNDSLDTPKNSSVDKGGKGVKKTLNSGKGAERPTETKLRANTVMTTNGDQNNDSAEPRKSKFQQMKSTQELKGIEDNKVKVPEEDVKKAREENKGSGINPTEEAIKNPEKKDDAKNQKEPPKKPTFIIDESSSDEPFRDDDDPMPVNMPKITVAEVTTFNDPKTVEEIYTLEQIKAVEQVKNVLTQLMFGNGNTVKGDNTQGDDQKGSNKGGILGSLMKKESQPALKQETKPVETEEKPKRLQNHGFQIQLNNTNNFNDEETEKKIKKEEEVIASPDKTKSDEDKVPDLKLEKPVVAPKPKKELIFDDDIEDGDFEDDEIGKMLEKNKGEDEF